jgi:hypothetical protein
MTTKRRTREGHRQIIENMAVELCWVSELGNDHRCIMALVGCRKFHPDDIVDHLDTAREMARAALRDEAGLWEKLMR